MRKEFWRNSTVAILAAGLLAVAAVAQTGEASGNVKIESGKAPAAQAQVKAAKPAKPIISDRDPFVNQVSGGYTTSSSVSSRRSSSGSSVRPANAASRTASAKAAANAPSAQATPEVEVPAPEVTITGIVKSRGTHQAIVNSGASSYIVVSGQKLGDYRVASITDTAVTFTLSGKNFKVPMESEFGPKK